MEHTHHTFTQTPEEHPFFLWDIIIAFLGVVSFFGLLTALYIIS